MHTHSWLLPSLILALVTTPVLAQSSSTPAKPNSPDAIDIWTEARPVLERELKVLAEAKSMTGSSLSRWEMQTEGQTPVTNDFPVDFALAKPENLYLNAKDIVVHTNGKVLTVYCKSLKQYITRPAPPIWSMRDTIEELSGGQVRSIPSEALLRPGMKLEQSFAKGIRTLEKTRDGDFDGRAGTWVTGTGFDERQPAAIPFTFERWYAQADGLLYVVKQDWTQMYQEMSTRASAEQNEGEANPKPAPKIISATWNTTFQRVLNADIPADRFVFTPGPDDKAVDRFIFPRPNLKEQTALIGQPAPEIVGTDLDGKTVKLSDHKGKVVVLDFWATWCGPCVQGLPHMQVIKDKNKDKSLVILGVNRDAAGTTNKVKRFLSKRGFTIEQFDDSAGRAAAAYAVNGIPCVVLIDPAGVVQDIDVGYLPGKERELSNKIDRILSGKPLRTPEELEKLRAQVGL